MKFKFLLLPTMLLAFLLSPAGLAAAPKKPAPDPSGEALLQLSYMQAALLEASLSLTPLERPEQKDAFRAVLLGFDRNADKFKELAKVGQPGHEAMTKYFKMLMERRLQLENIVVGIFGALDEGRQPDVFLVRGMPIALARLSYALKRTIQYLCESLAQKTKNPRRYTEALLIMGLSNSFAESIQVAYNQLYRTEALVEVGYWNTVADFEVLAASYKMIAGLSNPKNKTKAELFGKIDALQHQATMAGEKIVTAAKGVKPDFEAARKLKGFSAEAAPLFQKLIAASIRTE